MADQDVESRLAALEEQVARLRNGSGSAFRPVSNMTAANPFVFRGQTQIDHTKLKNRTRTLWFPVASATISVGTPALAIGGTNKLYQAWSFANGAVGTIACAVQIPTGVVEEVSTQTVASQATWRLYWTNLGAGSGNVVWEIDQACRTNTNVLNNALVAGTPQTIAAPSQDVLKTSTWVVNPFWPAGVSAYDIVQITITRTGTSGSDTLGNGAGLVALSLSYNSDM